MNINPVKFFIKRYHSPQLKAYELKYMLNLWIPFLFNRIRIISINNSFDKIIVELKYSFLNRNPYKSTWGGSLASVIDPFFPMMMKQNMLKFGMQTNFYTKAMNIDFIKEAKSNLIFTFSFSKEEISQAKNTLINDGKFQHWYDVQGIDIMNNICVKGKVQVYLKKR